MTRVTAEHISKSRVRPCNSSSSEQGATLRLSTTVHSGVSAGWMSASDPVPVVMGHGSSDDLRRRAILVSSKIGAIWIHAVMPALSPG